MELENTNTESSGTTPQSQEQVTLTEASDADIEAFLQSNLSDNSESEEETTDDNSVVEGEDSEPQKEAEQSEEHEKEQEEAPPADVGALNKRIAELEEKNLQLEREAENREAFVKRRSLELGELKKQLKEAREEQNKGLDELADESPRQAFERMNRIKDLDQQIEAVDREAEHIQLVNRNAEIFGKYLKPDEVSMEDMIQSLRDDKVEAGFIDRFKQSPFSSFPPEALVNLAKRAKAEKALRSIIPLVKQLAEENKKLKGKSKDILKGIDKAAKAVPGVTAARGNSGSVTRLNASFDPSKASDAELEDFLAAQRN